MTSPSNILACYLPFDRLGCTIKFIFTFETQPVQLDSRSGESSMCHWQLLIECQANAAIERSRFTHRVLSGLRFWKSTVPGKYDTGWVCSSSAYLSIFIQLLFRSLTTLAPLR